MRTKRKRRYPRSRSLSCGKTRFMNAAEAQMALLRIQGRSHEDPMPVRYYQCPDCHGWHLTSRPAWTETV